MLAVAIERDSPPVIGDLYGADALLPVIDGKFTRARCCHGQYPY